VQSEERGDFFELGANRLTIAWPQAQKLLLRWRQRFQLRVAVRVGHSVWIERDFLIECRRLQQYANRTFEHAIEVAIWVPELPVRITDARLQGEIHAGGTDGVESGDRVGEGPRTTPDQSPSSESVLVVQSAAGTAPASVLPRL
jgi:hypothetical protein